MDLGDVPIIGKTIGRDKPTEAVQLALSATEHSWSLISFTNDGKKIGVAAMGPIESFPIVAGIMERAGALPKAVSSSPIDKAVMKSLQDQFGDGVQ